jgi:hypothetical protein
MSTTGRKGLQGVMRTLRGQTFYFGNGMHVIGGASWKENEECTRAHLKSDRGPKVHI